MVSMAIPGRQLRPIVSIADMALPCCEGWMPDVLPDAPGARPTYVHPPVRSSPAGAAS